MSTATAELLIERRRATERRMSWSLSRSKLLSASQTSADEARAALRRRIDALEEQTGAQHDRIAALMHERNARPDDDDVAARLQLALDELLEMQREYAELMSAYYCPTRPAPSEDALHLLEEARGILKKYEDLASRDQTADDSLLPKP
ncbi:hypothetical protein SOCEGT47_077620 [Sorangium cellulosum]|uniref:Uncharacterized protein n=1 Tax=Sorangium cellulosum TaxID=56 RepID=A0A4P2QCQ8_SORCE|nr:hypothetical protein [Sorangium cellulosum]AUX27181.1 hypothetical protein SOCEGT47_077620 [Sorangium cellulosum]